MSHKDWMDQAWNQVVEKVGRTSKRIGVSYPHLSSNGVYDNNNSFWTKGFWPGMLWLIYRETKDEQLKDIAIAIENDLDHVLNGFYDLHHDVGFVWSLTSVAQYKLLHHEESKRRALIAASHMAGRFNIKGNFIRAWNSKQGGGRDNRGWVIIDCMMNLPILYWASETTGDPRFKHIAIAHADTVLKEHLRDDGSVHHIVCFDPDTGERVGAMGGQGYSPDSAWSRGASWAIHGFALSYRYTGELRYLQAAKKAAHYFIASLPEDCVPYWDLRAPIEADMPRDSTAAACAASGLIEISRLVDESEKRTYLEWAERIVKSLYEHYGAWDSEEEALLVKGTSHYPAGIGINTPIIYGDYFFTEALSKLRGNTELFW
ncbi:glycoside hydrolase family 88 protein [Paenibacillus sp. YYML68]|uniref:glycoside hydrolase family 88 protein n=1 Tax=Paenibacillus sp. YYML68 TaxID=2909250 RepID=UPI0024921EF8|nr:glycoside hydrolase family 88 protein [Paenibacillus sp. YYML68]